MGRLLTFCTPIENSVETVVSFLACRVPNGQKVLFLRLAIRVGRVVYTHLLLKEGGVDRRHLVLVERALAKADRNRSLTHTSCNS